MCTCEEACTGFEITTNHHANAGKHCVCLVSLFIPSGGLESCSCCQRCLSGFYDFIALCWFYIYNGLGYILSMLLVSG